MPDTTGEPEAPKTCLLIGQMTAEEDMERLRNLARTVLEPFLKPKGYEVILPDDPSQSVHIMMSVMERIDTAEILVADLTGNNANVYYELAARHSLGLPYVLVSEHDPKFDIATLHYTRYTPGRPQDKRDEIEDWLEEAHRAAMEGSAVDNPISDFYGRPLAEVSPASGLALGYFRNFLHVAVDDIRKRADSVEIREIPVDEDGRNTDDERWLQLTTVDRQRARFEVWIPRTLSEASHNAIDKHLVDRGYLNSARIVRAPRPFELYALPRTDGDDPVVLVDIPTAMNALQVAVDGRTPAGLAPDSAAWVKLETQEINRFRSAIEREMNRPENKVATEDITLRSGLPATKD